MSFRIFENAIDYLINVIVAHMRQICITDTEVVALFGLFIWKDGFFLFIANLKCIFSFKCFQRNNALSNDNARKYFNRFAYLL